MASSASPTGRLAIALHFSIPPVCAIGLCNILVVDKTFAIFKLLGGRLPTLASRALRATHRATEAALAVAAVFALARHCGAAAVLAPWRLRVDEAPLCVPALAGLAFARLCLLWTDRICSAFLRLPHSSALGAKYRVAHVAILVAAFSALSVDDPMALPLLAQTYFGRATRGWASRRANWVCRLFKVYVVAVAVRCVHTGEPSAPSSRRSACVALLAALSG